MKWKQYCRIWCSSAVLSLACFSHADAWDVNVVVNNCSDHEIYVSLYALDGNVWYEFANDVALSAFSANDSFSYTGTTLEQSGGVRAVINDGNETNLSPAGMMETFNGSTGRNFIYFFDYGCEDAASPSLATLESNTESIKETSSATAAATAETADNTAAIRDNLETSPTSPTVVAPTFELTVPDAVSPGDEETEENAIVEMFVGGVETLVATYSPYLHADFAIPEVPTAVSLPMGSGVQWDIDWGVAVQRLNVRDWLTAAFQFLIVATTLWGAIFTARA